MFENIIGNEQIKEILKSSIENQKTSHSYLFVGIQGIGKKLFAVEFAKKILCLEPMQEIENHPDFICVELDGNNIKIEQIRNLQKRIQEKPIISNKKIYIIDNAETMTTEAQNCLLKTLEEPPEFATIILIGSNENAFLPTIKSRCMILHFQPIENEKIKRFLEENFNITNLNENQLDLFQGSIGRAVSLKDKQQEYQSIDNIIENLSKKDLIEITHLAEPLYKAKDEIFEILEYMNLLLINKAKENYLYTNCIEIVENTKKRLKQNANYDMCIDNMLFNMWEELVWKI